MESKTISSLDKFFEIAQAKEEINVTNSQEFIKSPNYSYANQEKIVTTIVFELQK